MIALLHLVSKIPPVAWLRRSLRRIDYYSARRARSVWRRAIEWAVPVTALLAVGAMLVSEACAVREATIASVHGAIERRRDRSFVAYVVGEYERSPFEGMPWGEFDVRLVDERRGWPVPSHVARRRLRYDVRAFDETEQRPDVDFAPGDPLRAAIDGALAADGRTDLLAGSFDRGWLAWERLAGLAVWWAVLLVAATASIRIVELAARLADRMRAAEATRRIERGRCRRCGYDLRGVEFSARCPECGDLL